MELIDAAEVLQELNRADFDTYADYSHAFDVIDSAPIIDAVPAVHAYWNKMDYIWECSNCGESISMRHYMEYRMNFCNRCGAKMDAEGENGTNQP